MLLIIQITGVLFITWIDFWIRCARERVQEAKAQWKQVCTSSTNNESPLDSHSPS